MSESSATHDTFVIQRSYPKPAAAVFAAFSDPAKKRRWYAEGGGHDLDAFDMDFSIGGAERLRYRLGAATPFPGTPIETEGRHEDIVPERRIVISSTMRFGGRRISTAIVTFELAPDGGGTQLTLTHQAVFYEGADGPEMRRMGWEQLLNRFGEALAA